MVQVASYDRRVDSDTNEGPCPGNSRFESGGEGGEYRGQVPADSALRGARNPSQRCA
jgi:hypothetical protein